MTLSAEAHDDTRLRHRLGTMHDVRRILPLPRSKIYEYAQAGKAPGVVRVGRRLLLDFDVLDDWIDEGGGAPGTQRERARAGSSARRASSRQP